MQEKLTLTKADTNNTLVIIETKTCVYYQRFGRGAVFFMVWSVHEGLRMYEHKKKLNKRARKKFVTGTAELRFERHPIPTLRISAISIVENTKRGSRQRWLTGRDRMAREA